MAYDGLYGELSTRGAANEVLNLAIATKDEIEVIAEGVEDNKTTAEVSAAQAQVSADAATTASSSASISQSDAAASAATAAEYAGQLIGASSDLANNVDPDKGGALVGYSGRTVSERLSDTVNVLDYVQKPYSDTSLHQAGMEAALAAANTEGKELYWPIVLTSTANLSQLHSVRHRGPGGILVGSETFYVDPSPDRDNRLYIAPGGTGDGLSSARPLGGMNGCLDVLKQYAPLSSRWSITGAAGTYNESVIIPDWLAIGRSYLSWTFPAPVGDRAEPMSYPSKLSGLGISALQGFLSGAGNRMSIVNLAITDWFDTGMTALNQVRRGVAVSNGSFVFMLNCGFTGNGLSNVSALPGGDLVVTNGILDGSRYGVDNTGGRVSFSASSTTYSVIRNALEYGLYEKHDSSCVFDFTEFRNNGKVAGASSYGAAIFAYKSNASVDTRGCKFYQNNICWNVRGGFVADNPGVPDVYGTGADANTRRYLCRAGGVDDIDLYTSNAVFDITQRFGGGTTTSATDVTVLNAIATTREGYLANQDQCLRIEITARAQTGDALYTPKVRHAGGTVSLGTYRIAAGAYGQIRLNVRPVFARNALQVTFACIGAVQNLGISVGQIVSAAIDLPNVSLSVEIDARAEGGGTATLISCNVDKSG